MRVYSNTTTHRLEDFVRQQFHREFEIKVMEPHEDGRYFITTIDGEPLRNPVSLGWIDQHAVDSLKRRIWEHCLLKEY